MAADQLQEPPTRDQVLENPENFVGYLDRREAELWVLSGDRIVKRRTLYVPGLYKIFEEILLYLAENQQRDSLEVTINVKEELITVYTHGGGIPVIQENQIYLPELIFGHFGRNGYGATLANIFSTRFTIETADGNSKFMQVFSDNMGSKSEATVTECNPGGESWTRVSFKPDLSKFGVESLDGGIVVLMKKRVFDLAGSLGNTVKVELDGKRVLSNTFSKYVRLYPPSATRIHKKFSNGWEVCVCMSEGNFEQVSFVNNIATSKGGTHVDYIANQIADHVMKLLKKQDRLYYSLKRHHVKDHICLFVKAMIVNPDFDSQTKDTLMGSVAGFGSTCKLKPHFLNKVANSDIVRRVVSSVQFNQQNDLQITEVNTLRKVVIPKLEDAFYADSSMADECTLMLTEGDSAKSFVMSGLYLLDQDYIGLYPLKGKLLNVRSASAKQLQENSEIQNLIKIIGLQPDKIYNNTKSLRYGRLMIMADQDLDGSHMKGLIINFLHKFWPSLLKIPGFVVVFSTPIAKATKGPDVIPFYTKQAYKRWNNDPGNGATDYEIKYYHSLGTISSDEGAEYFANLDKYTRNFVWNNDGDGDAIELAFCKKKDNSKKKWLEENWNVDSDLDPKQKDISYHDFIYKELVHFSIAGLRRSIPSMVDGLKPVQRKVLFSAFKKPLSDEVKVTQFSGYVSEHSGYYHGEENIESAIVGMSQNHVGSNNINLLYPKGQFGTRQMGGKDSASGRYIYTQLPPITERIFLKSDEFLLQGQDEYGQSVEPIWYLPVIPMVLVNGAEGIGTGWSTSIPNYSPKVIIAKLRHRLNKNNKEEPLLHPWYRGFNGKILEPTAEQPAYLTRGIVRVKEGEPNTLIISELPIGTWSHDYKLYLNNLAESYSIEGYKVVQKYNGTDFEVILFEEQMEMAQKQGFEEAFRLETNELCLSITNMHLFTAEGVIKKYDSAEAIFDEFYELRLKYYTERKEKHILELQKALSQLEQKQKLIYEILDGTMPSTEDMEMLHKQHAVKLAEFHSLQAISEEQLWLLDLDALEKDLDALYEQDKKDADAAEKKAEERKEAYRKAHRKEAERRKEG